MHLVVYCKHVLLDEQTWCAQRFWLRRHGKGGFLTISKKNSMILLRHETFGDTLGLWWFSVVLSHSDVIRELLSQTEARILLLHALNEKNARKEIEYEWFIYLFPQLFSINYCSLWPFCPPTAVQELDVQELRMIAEEFFLITVVVFPKASQDWIHKLDIKLTSVLCHIWILTWFHLIR